MKVFKIIKRNKQTGEITEYFTDNFTKWREKYDLDKDFRRSIEKASEKNKWYKPRTTKYDWKKESVEVTEEDYMNGTMGFELENLDEGIHNEENRITITTDNSIKCDNCGSKGKYNFREMVLCDSCYHDNNTLLDIINKSFERKTNLDRIIELEERRILVIGDVHAPFDLEGYLDFCKHIYKKYDCNVVLFTGDILDMHFSSFHDTDPDGMGAGMELELAKKRLHRYYKAFPNALVCLGNHDRISNRKGLSSGLSSKWIKTIDEILEVPNWTFSEKFVIDGVMYNHGLGGDALSQLNKNMTSTVCGHYHMKSFTHFKVGADGGKKFAMQIGCGCDEDKYAFAYGRHFGKMQINVGVVLNNGKLPIIEHYSDWRDNK